MNSCRYCNKIVTCLGYYNYNAGKPLFAPNTTVNMLNSYYT